jgi:large subunit ribosomal protein L6
MSRLGKKPVEVPGDVKVDLAGRTITISGKTGALSFEHRPEVKVAYDTNAKHLEVTIDPKDADKKFVKALWGTTRATLANMIVGVQKGYEKKLEVVGVGYTAQLTGKNLKLKVGFANAIEVPIPQGLNVKVEQQFITVTGPDKQLVGQFASVVRSQRKPEPYNGKGIKYTTETIRRKQGKAFGS